MYNNIKMRLTPFTVVSTSTALVVGLILLLGTSPISAFRLSEDGKGHPEAESQPNNILNNNRLKDISNNNEATSSNNNKGLPSHQSSLSSSSSPSQSESGAEAASSSASSSSARSISKRSLSSSFSSSDASMDPSRFRSHRHENSILNVAWPPNAMWGFLPSKKKSAQQFQPLSLHSQSATSTSSFNKKASSLSSPSDSSVLGKKKSASSDLFLDPVTLEDERATSFFSNHHQREGVGAGSAAGASAPTQNFFHSAPSSGSAPASSGSNGGGSNKGDHPTPPPQSHYILLKSSPRIEPPLGNDIGAAVADDDLLENEILNEEESRDLQGGDHASWLKRSSSSQPGIVTRASSDTNKRTIKYDIPQIECPPADDGMERFACPSADRVGRYRCVDDHVLCDGFIDCPGKEDEDLQACMFYKTTKAHLDVLADALLRWARGKR